ncbi:hypothetical protein CLAFUW4_12351 [Fulvia fulva]|nr:hypothetical protein CLAFUR4_12356 [Fulvia fulva]WPV17868.1 hypothetical protein CLAFUW4_12351 [Fulvia fulva]WPV33142.1 hypothetical protein CLAFUW7_12358 [Fulvia fulva]
MATDSISLRCRLEVLSQELYDEIYNLTFTAGNGGRLITGESDFVWHGDVVTERYLDRSVRYAEHDSLNLFLVDRASSTKFAASFETRASGVPC